MAILSRDNGTQNHIIRIGLVDSSTGAPKTSLTNTTSGLIVAAIADIEATTTAYTAAASLIDTITTLGTYQAPSATHCRFKEVDATNHPGLYEIHLPNTRFAVTGASYLDISVQAAASSVAVSMERYDLDAQVDLFAINATTVTAPSGVLAVNAAQINGVSAETLGLEIAGRVKGTISAASGGYTPTANLFECANITDAAGFSLYQNRGFLVTSGTQAKSIGTIRSDLVGTTGRRFLVATLVGGAPTAGDTLVIL